MFENITNFFKTAAAKALKNTKAVLRATAAALAIPVVLGLVAAQKYIVGPVFHNTTFIRKAICKAACAILGYKIEFNIISAPPTKGIPVWSVLNHQSSTDALVAGSFLDGSIVGKGDILGWPIISEIAKAGGFIGIHRKPEFNPQSRAKIIENFNNGNGTIMFPEGTTNDSGEVGLFRAALPKLLYGGEEGQALDKNGRPVELETEVVVQPVAIRVKEVDGRPVEPGASDDAENNNLRRLYSRPDSKFGTLGRLWKRLQTDTTLEVTVFPALDPKAYPDAEKLLTQAARDVASVVNPGQTTFRKSRIPVSTLPQNP